MKKIIYAACCLLFLGAGFSASGQVYKTAEDTVKLNKEFTEVSNEIASLTAKLTIAQNNKPGYEAKANAAELNAQDAAVSSSVQASKAAKGGVKEARKAKRKSRQAYREAKDARSVSNDVGDLDERIASLKGQLAKKQERLDQLTTMRTAINAQLSQQ